MIPVPGHTRGSAALLHGSTLFTGDHLWADDVGTALTVAYVVVSIGVSRARYTRALPAMDAADRIRIDPTLFPAQREYSLHADAQEISPVVDQVTALIDDFIEKGECDFVDQFAAQLPGRVFFASFPADFNHGFW